MTFVVFSAALKTIRNHYTEYMLEHVFWHYAKIWSLIFVNGWCSRGNFPYSCFSTETHRSSSACCCCHIIFQIWKVWINFTKLSNIKYHEKSFSCSLVVSCIQMDRLILMAALQRCDAPKIDADNSSCWLQYNFLKSIS